MLRPTGKAKRIYDHLMKGEEMPRKKQGYKARLDESLGERHRGRKKKQSLKARRDESEAMERHYGRRPYAAVTTMDKARKRAKKK